MGTDESVCGTSAKREIELVCQENETTCQASTSATHTVFSGARSEESGRRLETLALVYAVFLYADVTQT